MFNDKLDDEFTPEDIFNEDVLTKAKINASSKNIPAKASTRIPSKTELEKMSKELFKVNIKKPITFAVFTTLPIDIQKMHIQWILDNFKINMLQISKYFKHDISTLCKIRKKGNSGLVLIPNKSKFPSEIDKQNFANWYNDSADSNENIVIKESENTIEEPVKEENISIKEEKVNMPISSLNITFKGEYSPESIIDFLNKVLNKKDKATININIERWNI